MNLIFVFFLVFSTPTCHEIFFSLELKNNEASTNGANEIDQKNYELSSHQNPLISRPSWRNLIHFHFLLQNFTRKIIFLFKYKRVSVNHHSAKYKKKSHIIHKCLIDCLAWPTDDDSFRVKPLACLNGAIYLSIFKCLVVKKLLIRKRVIASHIFCCFSFFSICFHDQISSRSHQLLILHVLLVPWGNSFLCVKCEMKNTVLNKLWQKRINEEFLTFFSIELLMRGWHETNFWMILTRDFLKEIFLLIKISEMPLKF